MRIILIVCGVVLAVVLLLCGGCLFFVGFSRTVVDKTETTPTLPANVVIEESDSAPAAEPIQPVQPAVEPTPLPVLKQFAAETDNLFEMLDQAHAEKLIEKSAEQDDGAAWDNFARTFNAKYEHLQKRSADFRPARAQALVGSTAEYAQQLFRKLASREPEAYEKYREFCRQRVKERDEYLAQREVEGGG